MNEAKLTIKDLLFTKAIPNYVIPVPTQGRKVYSCTDCGDRFLFKSSYDVHINRTSLKITYTCRLCTVTKIFYNRCKLLAHIRSHAFKTATINVSDLNIEPLPLNAFNIPVPTRSETPKNQIENKIPSKNLCYECKEDIDATGVIYKDRAKHYMTNEKNMVACYSCPVCLFSLPSTCALKAHLRIHLKRAPYFCPECGVHLPNKSVNYPYTHDCEGFKMIRATTRLKCFNKNCRIFHPNGYRSHMKSHVKKVYKCPICSFMWNEMPPEPTHALCNATIICYYVCPLCPSKILTKGRIHGHLSKHMENYGSQLNLQVFPCRKCYACYEEVPQLLNHHVKKHGASKSFIESVLLGKQKSKPSNAVTNKGNKSIYRVVKRCEKCQRSFTYRCPYANINILPNECPYRCSMTTSTSVEQTKQTSIEGPSITCFICKEKVSENWEQIKTHFSKFHRTHKCVDVKVLVEKHDKLRHKKNGFNKIKHKSKKKKHTGDSNKSTEESSSSNLLPSVVNFFCIKCDSNFGSKESLESHIVTHRDPCMAYQCLECGKCFAVKPSFSTHLLLEHCIPDVQAYINEKQCYNELALTKHENNSEVTYGPLEENQCRICREKFEDQEVLEKHFRVHGMAFLLKNTNRS